MPTTVICGTNDKLTSIGHSRKLHARIAGSTLLECEGAGHMVILERHDQVNAELDQLIRRPRSGSRGTVNGAIRAVAPVGAESAEVVLAVVRDAFGARPDLDPPAAASAETVESVRRRLAHHGGLLAPLDGPHPSARWCWTRSATRRTFAGSASSPTPRGAASPRR